MNKEKEALLKEILAQPDVPRKVSPKNLLRFVDSCQPQTQDMRDYLMSVFSSETHAESRAISEAWYAKMTLTEQQEFSEAYYRCCMNQLRGNRNMESATVEALAQAA
jgi:hypothetical protein